MSGIRVVVADDHVLIRAGITHLLRSLDGVEVVGEAGDGMETLAVVERTRPDVVLLDIGMPEVSGYDVARAIRREVWGRNMRLIALTGWGQAEHRRRSLEVGFDDHLVKPVELDMLENLLQMGISAPISGKVQPMS